MPTIEWQEDWINVIEVFDINNKRKGLGTLLLNKIKEIAKENASHQISAYSDISNYDVYAFWLRNNFVVLPVKDNVSGNVLGSLVGYKL